MGLVVMGAWGADGDPWRPVRFLVGTWEAKSKASTGEYTFRMDLGAHLLTRISKTASCKSGTEIDCEHTDLLHIYPEGAGLKAIYFDNEGHVIHYDVNAPGPNTVVLLSPAGGQGPQFRLSYELKDGEMRGKFELRMGEAAPFRPYLEWSGRKRE